MHTILLRLRVLIEPALIGVRQQFHKYRPISEYALWVCVTLEPKTGALESNRVRRLPGRA
jgi:hypothetical protein